MEGEDKKKRQNMFQNKGRGRWGHGVMQLVSCNSRHATRVMQLQLASCDAISCAGNTVDGRAWEKEAGGERHEGEEFSQMRQCARNVLGGLLSVLRQIVLGVM